MARSHRMRLGWPSSVVAGAAQHLQVTQPEQQHSSTGNSEDYNCYTYTMGDGVGLLQQPLCSSAPVGHTQQYSNPTDK
jgi:hypothetical protein